MGSVMLADLDNNPTGVHIIEYSVVKTSEEVHGQMRNNHPSQSFQLAELPVLVSCFHKQKRQIKLMKVKTAG